MSQIIGIIILISIIMFINSISKQEVIYHLHKNYDTLHIGDENIKNWSFLRGDCFTAMFYVARATQTLTLQFDILDSDVNSNVILLNDINAGILPYQKTKINKWIKEKVILNTYGLRLKKDNKITICSGIHKIGDKDDLQLKNIRLIVKFHPITNKLYGITGTIIALLAIFGSSVGFYNYITAFKNNFKQEKP